MSGLSYRELHRRVVRSRRHRGDADLPSYDTVYRCLQPGRSRLDVELVVDIVRELQPDAEDAPHRWRRAHQVITGLAAEASVVDVRAELPPDEPAFVGRSPAMAAVLGELAGPGPRIIAIDGMPGVGKSTLAVRVAHLAADLEAFTVDLRGFATDRPPADPAAVLDGLVRRLAPAGSRAPHAIEDKIQRFRELTARRTVVLLLDNAASADQVRPLLPMTDGSVVLVTSRHRLVLPGLAITLDVLDPAESVELLSRSTGETGPELAQLADLAGHLPLALTLLAGHIRDHPDWTLADHVDRLRERRTMLRLDGGIELALRAAYERLTPPHRALLRALSAPRGVDVDEYAGAALAGCDVPTAQSLLGGLHRSNLIRQPRPGRYQLHDTMRVFAGARAIDEDSVRDRQAALARLHDLLLAAAALAMDVIAPHERDKRPRIGPVGGLPALADADAATAWLDAERANLMAAAIASPRPRFAPLLSQTIARYLALHAYEQDAETLHLAAVRSAEGAELGRVLLSLGAVYWRRGLLEPAAERYREALAQSDDPAVQCGAYTNLGLVHSARAQYPAALREQQLAHRACRLTGDRTMEARILNNLGFVSWRLGRLHDALSYFVQAIDLARAVGDGALAGQATGNAGYIHYHLGNYDLALVHTRTHLDHALESGHRGAEGDARSQLGLIHLALGDLADALAEHTAALRLFTEIGWLQKRSESLNDFGGALARHGDHRGALECHEVALAIATELGATHERSRAEAGIAAAQAATATAYAGRHDDR